MCQPNGQSDSFLCPNGTQFNQKYFVCDWWYNVDCGEAEGFYNLNSELYKDPEPKPARQNGGSRQPARQNGSPRQPARQNGGSRQSTTQQATNNFNSGSTSGQTRFTSTKNEISNSFAQTVTESSK